MCRCWLWAVRASVLRLKFVVLGYLDDPPRALHTYFRRDSSVEVCPV
ncbi:MAG: hypothetical protein LC808_19810 [Actinobacteria bacterium]|nr:hypothetical protein [Actinomycetota bacterium]